MRRTLRENSYYRLNHHAVVVKLYHLLNFRVMFAHLIGESRLFRRMVTFLIIASYKYSYLLTGQFLVDNHVHGSSME